MGKSDSFKKILEDLDWNCMSLPEYQEKVKSGILVNKHSLEDDLSFQTQHPDHPLACDNRFKRISASDMILDIARRNRNDITQEI